MAAVEQRVGQQQLHLENCPHCGVAAPMLHQVWRPQQPMPRADGRPTSFWSIYSCTACGGLITAKGRPGEVAGNSPIVALFPDIWEADGTIPEQARHYLTQANRTLHAPDASVIMSAASIDAMLKDNGLHKGSLYERIDQAVENGLLTQKMADWAHRVRLDANKPRHADDKNPNMTDAEARRAFDFAKALTEFLYILPSRMPKP